ncbi:hypothetical protein CCZ01_01925 [Helicobacter monodelphidis]|uniref:hypothetical protein n=1 Tax=Helicobacter sp. 15-1451 TaxID=2004995 RepID=UPI000DCC96DF|nr:hypothetical protein [Helicobacter sp. 15-1451]RAX58565.1 hypothetical protein CCZ01_01925 [Helicobacter sp. 15-1451]
MRILLLCLFACIQLYAKDLKAEEEVMLRGELPRSSFLKADCYTTPDSEECRDLSLSGMLVFQNRPSNQLECEGTSSIALFYPDEESVESFRGILIYGADAIKVSIKGDKALYERLDKEFSQWYKEGLMGEVRFLLKKGTFYNFSAADMVCNGGWIYQIEAKDIELGEKIFDELGNREQYGKVFGGIDRQYDSLLLNSKKQSVNLYISPNKKVIATILPAKQKQILLYRIDHIHTNKWGDKRYPITFDESIKIKNQQEKHKNWVKVIYFPPEEQSGKKAYMGYIKRSDINAESLRKSENGLY